MTALHHHTRQSRVVATVRMGTISHEVRNEKVRKCYGDYRRVAPVWELDFSKVGEQILIVRPR